MWPFGKKMTISENFIDVYQGLIEWNQELDVMWLDLDVGQQQDVAHAIKDNERKLTEMYRCAKQIVDEHKSEGKVR